MLDFSLHHAVSRPTCHCLNLSAPLVATTMLTYCSPLIADLLKLFVP